MALYKLAGRPGEHQLPVRRVASCGTSATTPTSSALILQREFAPRVAAIHGDLPQLRHLVIRRTAAAPSLEGLEFADYEDAVAGGIARARLRRSARTTTST